MRLKEWEVRVSYFGAYLIEAHKVKSSTLKSYISALKHTIKNDGYEWNDSKVWLSSLVKSCKIQNDVVKICLPIKFNLLEQILFEIDRYFNYAQPYLTTMYKAMFSLAYYGLMRVSELADGPHAVKARNIELGTNKNKIKIELESSKTHGKESPPQKQQAIKEIFIAHLS